MKATWWEAVYNYFATKCIDQFSCTSIVCRLWLCVACVQTRFAYWTAHTMRRVYIIFRTAYYQNQMAEHWTPSIRYRKFNFWFHCCFIAFYAKSVICFSFFASTLNSDKVQKLKHYFLNIASKRIGEILHGLWINFDWYQQTNKSCELLMKNVFQTSITYIQ